MNSQQDQRLVVGARAVQSVVTEREAITYEIAEIIGDVLTSGALPSKVC